MTEPQDEAPEHTGSARGPSGRVVAFVALGVIVVVLALVILAVQDRDVSRVAGAVATTTAQTSSRPPSPARSAAVPETPATTTVPAVADPRDRAELAQVVAQLDAGLALSSPPSWDQ